jgi:uncharacterized protein YndB with AHSA1/START domain
MPVSTAANSASFKVSTPSDREIRLTRLFDAPRELVFEALTKPEHIREWWGRLGDGYSVPVCEMDLRVGGRWRFVNRHPQGDAAFSGEILELVPPGRIVYTELFEAYPDGEPSTVTAELVDENGKTRMTVTARYSSLDVRDMVLGTGMEKGAAISYDRLEDLVVRLRNRV